MRHFVVSASQLEGEDRLEVLSFEKYIAFQAIAEIDGMSQRSRLDHVVNLCRQDQSQILSMRSARCMISKPSNPHQDTLWAIETLRAHQHAESSLWELNMAVTG